MAPVRKQLGSFKIIQEVAEEFVSHWTVIAFLFTPKGRQLLLCEKKLVQTVQFRGKVFK